MEESIESEVPIGKRIRYALTGIVATISLVVLLNALSGPNKEVNLPVSVAKIADCDYNPFQCFEIVIVTNESNDLKI